MRYDAQHKERTRARVLKEAARAIRADGPERVAVAEVMSRAGLTHGGFYAHFRNKDDLVAEAVRQMFAETVGEMEAYLAGKGAGRGLGDYIDFYLSPLHRDGRDIGCPIPTLSADLPRLNEDARRRFEEGLARLTGLVAQRLAEMGHEEAEPLSISVMAELVGALAMARAVEDRARSDAILAAARRSLRRRLQLDPL